MSLALLRARVDLADAIVKAARAQRDDAAARPMSAYNRSLYEGAEAALAMREQEAYALRAKLIRRVGS